MRRASAHQEVRQHPTRDLQIPEDGQREKGNKKSDLQNKNKLNTHHQYKAQTTSDVQHYKPPKETQNNAQKIRDR